VALSLRAPDGTILTPADVGTNPDLSYVSEPFFQAFTLNAPMAGQWTILAAAGAIVTGQIEADAAVDNEGVQLTVSATSDTLEATDTMEIQARVEAGGQNVSGVLLTGTVTRPDGSQADLPLYDDGLPEHGDAVAGDGIYSGRFSDYTVGGTYAVQVKAVNAAGETVSGEALDSDVPFVRTPVLPFTRIATTSVIVDIAEFGGWIYLEGCQNPAQTIHFEFRPQSGAPGFTLTQTLGPDGSFDLKGFPSDVYEVRIKGSKWLAISGILDTTFGPVTDLFIFLNTGDVNNDNTVDITDLGDLADAFFSTPDSPNWNENADLNCDGKVDIFDLGLLADNYGATGAP
jgi:hypothetical protein